MKTVKPFLRGFVITFCVFMSVGCSSPGIKIIDKNYMSSLGENKNISIFEFNSNHEGSMGKQLAAVPAVLISPLVFSLLVGLVQAGSTETLKLTEVELQNLDYPTKLQIECFREMEKVLKNSKLFAYVNTNKLKVINNKFNNEQDYIKQIITDNNLSSLLRINLKYIIVPGWKKRVALRSDWTLFGLDGRESVNIRTIVISKFGMEVFVDTKDPKYEKTFTDLAAKNAEDFLSVLSGNEPIHGKETISK